MTLTKSQRFGKYDQEAAVISVFLKTLLHWLGIIPKLFSSEVKTEASRASFAWCLPTAA